MNNDLISRSELKKAIDFNKICFDCPIVRGNDCDDCKMALIERRIDNAPTVCGNNPKWCESCVSKGKCASTRPQGEWIEKQETPASVSYYCSNCKMRDLPFLPYCPWCGAKMKGGAENE